MAQPAVDLAEFEAFTGSSLTECKVARAAAQLSAADQRNLAAALATASATISHSGIVKWFRARNVAISDQSIRHHRKGVCCCGRSR